MHTDDNRIRKSLRFSLIDGVFASSMIGFTQDYFTPFLLLLGATTKHVGMLIAIPNLFASLVQLKSADVTEKLKSRKKIMNIFVLLQALMLLPMAIIAFLGKANPIIFIITVVFFASFGAISVPAWASLMSDLVAENKRGQYFGWRNKTLGFIIVLSAFIAGLILHFMKKINVFGGFAIIFGLAFLFRVISWYFLSKMFEPKLEYHKQHYFTLVDFLSRIRESNFAKFVLFVAMMNFSVNLASPFFAVFMLKDLHLSYMLYSIITVAATFTVYSMMERWGRHADKTGNLKVIKFVSPVIAIIPLLWITNHNPIFLILIQIIAGFAWAGFNLCASNFIYDAVTPEKRTRCVAYFNVLNGLALSCGALLGGFLIEKLPMIFDYRIFTLFLLSSVLRIIVSLIMPKKIKEVKLVQKVRSFELFFSMIGIRPMLGIERKTVNL